MANKFIVATAPHMHSPLSTQRLMRDVLIAVMPALAVSVVVYGVSVLYVTAIAVASCVLVEYLIQKFILKGETTVGNLSAVVTGVLLAFNLPANIAWWIIVIGAVVAIGVAKMTFGGLGRNPFNPALVGRVFLLIAYQHLKRLNHCQGDKVLYLLKRPDINIKLMHIRTSYCTNQTFCVIMVPIPT